MNPPKPRNPIFKRFETYDPSKRHLVSPEKTPGPETVQSPKSSARYSAVEYAEAMVDLSVADVSLNQVQLRPSEIGGLKNNLEVISPSEVVVIGSVSDDGGVLVDQKIGDENRASFSSTKNAQMST